MKNRDGFVKLKYFTTCILLATTTFCAKHQNQEKIISEDNMVQILKDVHILDTEISARGMVTDSSKIYFYRYQSDIFKKHHTDSSQFYRSYKYYLQQGVSFDRIYARVVDSLSILESK